VASNGFLDDLDRQAAPAVRRMAAEYARVQKVLLSSLDDLQAKIGELEAPTREQLYRLDRYQTMLAQVQAEMSRLGAIAANESRSVNEQAADLGAQAAAHMGSIATNDPNVIGVFNRMDLAGVARATSFVQDDSPLYGMLRNEYGHGWAKVIAQQYVTGVALGWSPRRTIATIRQTMTVGMESDIERIIRTAQLWSYRTTNQATWVASGVVKSWVWSCTMDGKVCGSCWALHGTRHPVSEVLNDHHRGRCAAIPEVAGSADYTPTPLNVPSGEEVFNSLPPSKQERFAQQGGWAPHYRAYRDGAIRFDQMPGKMEDAIYGEMRVVKSLKEILGEEEAAKYYAR
jgi:hypothetical protein